MSSWAGSSVDAIGSSALLAYAQLIVPGQPPSMVQPAKMLPLLPPPALPPPAPPPAVPLLPPLPPAEEPAVEVVPPMDEPADEVVPPLEEPAVEVVPPADDPADDVLPPVDELPATEEPPPLDEPADDDAPALDDVPPDDLPATDVDDEPADEVEPPVGRVSAPESSLVEPQATTTGVTASANAQAIDEIRMNGNPRFCETQVAPDARRPRLAEGQPLDSNATRVIASSRPDAELLQCIELERLARLFFRHFREKSRPAPFATMTPIRAGQ